MLTMVIIEIHEARQACKLFPEPLEVPILLTHKKGMLRKTGLMNVHVYLVGESGISSARSNQDRNSSRGIGFIQKIQNTAIFVFANVLA
jgi:hypothetical protein